jgi:small-conductance mechanosensitive channel
MEHVIRGLHTCLVAVLIIAAALTAANAAQKAEPPGQGSTATPEEPPAQVRALLNLLSDTTVQKWLEKQGAAKVAAASAPETDNSVEDYLDRRAGVIHEQIDGLARAIPDLPNQFEQAAARDSAMNGAHGRAWALFNLGVFLALGFAAEWLFRKMAGKASRQLDGLPAETVNDRLRLVAVRFALALGKVAAFALATVGLFLAIYWSPILRGTVLGILIAAVVIRAAAAIGHWLFAPEDERCRIIPTDEAGARFWCWRLTAFVGWFVLGWLIVQECGTLDFSFEGRQLVGYTLGLGLLAIALEAVWRGHLALRDVVDASAAGTHRFGRGARNVALSVGVISLWLLWVAAPGLTGVSPGFWLVLVMMALPLAILVSRRAVEHLLRPMGSSDADEGEPPSVVVVCVERGIRALLIIGAVTVLAWAWGIDIVQIAGQNTQFARIAHGVLSAVIILLVADLLWQVTKAAIDRKLAEVEDLGQPNTDEARRRARLRTLLPIFRNVLFVVVVVFAGMMSLAAMGVEIGPLVAAAGVLGVALGFGAQSLVRDVIAGMFYLLDDAFRVGEYIQSGNYKGTVESFSFRSVRLRHQRGALYTVPFGLLGAVQNQSRDWVIDKLTVGITYDSDIDRARKLIKQIGLELAQDPEFAPVIIEPLKMQGVDALGDFAVQLRMKMMTLPGENFVIRRKALAMIKAAFDANGIKFAFPTVQIAGDGEPSTAAAAHRVLELTKPTAA